MINIEDFLPYYENIGDENFISNDGDNTYISMYTLHGAVIEDSYHVVPENTIIVFLSHLDNANSYQENKFIGPLRNLTYPQYRHLFNIMESTFQSLEITIYCCNL